MKTEENVFYISNFSIFSREVSLFWDIFFNSILLLQIQYNSPVKQQNV